MGLYLDIASFILCISMLIAVIFILKKEKYILMIILFILIFFTYTKCLEEKYDKAFIDLGENTKLFVRLVSNSSSGNYYDKYEAKVVSGKYKNYKILIHIKNEKEFEYGDVLEIFGTVSKPNEARNKNGFDYSKYLRQKEISASIIIEAYNKIDVHKDFFYYIHKIKNICLSRVEKMYNETEIGFLKAILFGEINEVDEEIKNNFKISNLSHVLAISGMHITYIVIGLDKFLKTFLKSVKLRNFLIIIFLLIFIPFVGGSASVVRAGVMTILAYIAKILLEKEDFYSSFCIALFIILLINPYNINSISMWLSFGGSIGIVTFSKFLYKIFTSKVNNKLLKKIIEVSTISIAAQIIIFPIMLYYFNTSSLTFWVSNVLISELIGPILILGYLSVILYPVGVIFSYIEKILIKIMFFIAHICTKIPFNQFFMPTPKLYLVIGYYGIICYFIYEFNKNKIYYLRKILNKKNIIKLIKKFLVLAIGIIILFKLNYFIPQNLRINFLDVGQGDCTLVRTAKNKVILIDSGEGNGDKYDYGEKVIFPYLLDEGIMKIDYMIISHFDSDHAGGMFYILENMKVKNIVIGIQAEEYGLCREFISLAQEKKVRIIALEKNDMFRIDKETYLEVFFPDVNNTISENKINNNSLVFKLVYNEFSMLFTGDIEETAEKYLVDIYGYKLKATILKVAHHGSKTSSTEEFINCVNPKIALIGVGQNNNFGHPNQEVIERLMKNDIKVYRTDETGEISIRVKKRNIVIKNKITPL